jgi:hypothetical protein
VGLYIGESITREGASYDFSTSVGCDQGRESRKLAGQPHSAIRQRAI